MPKEYSSLTSEQKQEIIGQIKEKSEQVAALRKGC